jgi:hypothetical protein
MIKPIVAITTLNIVSIANISIRDLKHISKQIEDFIVYPKKFAEDDTPI